MTDFFEIFKRERRNVSNNANEVDIPDERPFYWKPESVGASLYGRLESIEASKHGKVGVFAPVLLKDAAGKVEVLAEARVGLNWSLKARIIPERIGRLIGITFIEEVPTSEGMAKAFKVVEVRDASAFKEKVRKLSAGDVTWPPETTGDEPDDDLPF